LSVLCAETILSGVLDYLLKTQNLVGAEEEIGNTDMPGKTNPPERGFTVFGPT
jgi:hypothetical protein